MPVTLHNTKLDPALNMARQTLYRFTALALLDPKAGTWEQLGALREEDLLIEAAALIRALPEAQPQALALGERPLAELDPEPVLERLPDSQEALNREYENTFGLLVSCACPPYETEYINSKFTFQRSQTLADVSGFYSAFGLTTSSLHPERPDHVVQELEFMAFLIGLTHQAATSSGSGRRERLEVCQAAQSRFLRDHLAWWTPAFARLLSLENPGGLFAATGIFLSALIAAERAILNVPVSAPVDGPSSVEPPDACEGCQLQMH